jgi:hypothetical protein
MKLTFRAGHVRQAGGDSRLKLRCRGYSGVGGQVIGGLCGGRERDRRPDDGAVDRLRLARPRTGSAGDRWLRPQPVRP